MAAVVHNISTNLQNQIPRTKTLIDANAVVAHIEIDDQASTQDAITASTTQSQAGGTLITAAFSVVATANASDAITFPLAVPGRRLTIVNHSTQTIQAFPAVGDAINAASANAAVTIANATTSIYVCGAVKQWWGGAITNEA